MSFWFITKSSLGKMTVVLQSKAELRHEEDGQNLIKDHKYDASVMVVKTRFLYHLLHLMFSVTNHFYNLVLSQMTYTFSSSHFLFLLSLVGSSSISIMWAVTYWHKEWLHICFVSLIRKGLNISVSTLTVLLVCANYYCSFLDTGKTLTIS